MSEWKSNGLSSMPNCALDPLGSTVSHAGEGGDIKIKHNTQDSVCGLQHLPVSWSVCTSRSWLQMETRQFQDKTSRHPCYQLEMWDQLAFDITVESLLNSINMLEAGIMVRANARSILVRSYPQTPQQENDNTLNTLGIIFCMFSVLCCLC